MPTVLTREQVLAANDIEYEFVKVPEWSGGDPEAGVWVRGLMGNARDDFEIGMIEQRGKKQQVNLRNLRAKLVVRVCVDSNDPETAKEIFTLMDIGPLGRKSAAALQRVYAVGQRLSGLSPEDVEDLTKELGETPDSDSGTGLPSLSGILLSLPQSEPSAAESTPDGKSTTDTSPSATDD